MAAASGLADRSGRVLTVVAGQIEIGDMQKRTAPVVLQLPVDDSSPILEGREMGVDQRIGDPRSSEAGERALHPTRRQVLDHAVVLVEPDVLPGLGDEQLIDRPNSPIHRRHATGHRRSTSHADVMA